LFGVQSQTITPLSLDKSLCAHAPDMRNPAGLGSRDKITRNRFQFKA
jgi:hypothetical protein